MLKVLLSNRHYSSSWIFERAKQKMSSSNKNVEQKFNFLFVLDFEATCDTPRQTRPQEVIELPCIKLKCGTGGNLNEVARFHRYVRPVVNPRLSHFCTELTGIAQDMVDEEQNFQNVFREFNEWLSQETSNFTSPFAFVTCGDWDLKTMLPSQCKTSNIDLPDHFNKWINIKRSCHGATGTFPRGMHRLLEYTGTAPFQGRQHSGIDDCENIARVAKALATKGHVFQINCSRTVR